MMTPRPTIFISAVSSELKSARQLVANTLQFLGYAPVWQDIFGTEQGDLRAMLRGKIDDSQGVVQVIGQRYGAEPPMADPQFGRVSYTQYEALYAKQQGKKVWYLIVGADFPTDPATPEPPDLRQMQQTYRQSLRGQSLYHTVHTSEGMEASVLKLRNDLSLLRQGVRRWALAVSVVLILIAGGVAWLVMHRDRLNVTVTNVPHDDVQEAYADLQTKLGLHGADLTASDIRVTLAPSGLPSMVKINLDFPPKYEPLLNYYKKTVTFNDGTPQVFMSNMMPLNCDLPVDQIKSVKVELDTIYEMTHELEKVGPLAVTPKIAAPGAIMPGFPTIPHRTSTDVLHDSNKTQALAQKVHLRDNGSYYLGWVGLNYYYPVIARLHFGEDPKNLDRTIDVHQPEGELTAHTWSQFDKDFDLFFIPYREGSTVYTQLELRDGTRSRLLKATPPESMPIRTGIELTPQRGQDPNLRLFAAFNTGKSIADFTPVVPDGTRKVSYTFDGGGYFSAERKEGRQKDTNAAWRVGYRFQGPLADATIQLKYESENGTTVGPASFELKNVKQRIADDLKSHFIIRQENALICLKLIFDLPVPPGTPDTEFRRIDSGLSQLGLPKLEHAPVALCMPRSFHTNNADRTLRGDHPDRITWAAVQQVNLGTKSGHLDQIVPVSIDPAAERNNETTARDLLATLPPETEQLYVRFTFRDGTSSPEIRVPVVTITKEKLLGQ
jgi:hypothetical protein